MTILAMMGGAELDLRRAKFAAPEVVITINAFMGGAQVIVGADTRVQMEGTGIMGGYSGPSGLVEADRRRQLARRADQGRRDLGRRQRGAEAPLGGHGAGAGPSTPARPAGPGDVDVGDPLLAGHQPDGEVGRQPALGGDRLVDAGDPEQLARWGGRRPRPGDRSRARGCRPPAWASAPMASSSE